MPVDENALLEKANKGEKLSKEETDYLKSKPRLEPTTAPVAEDEGPLPGVKKSDEKASDKADTGEAVKTPEKTEATPSEKPVRTADETGKESLPADRLKRLESELDKPEGQQDLTGFSPTEIGLFIDLRKQRKRAQKAEEESEALRFQRLQEGLKQKEQEKAKEEPEVKDPLDGKDDDDVITVGEVREALKAVRPVAKQDNGQIQQLNRIILNTQVLEAKLSLSEKGIKDFDQVMPHAEEVLGDDPDAKEYLTDLAKKGGNIALATYNLIKANKRWPTIEEKIKPDRNTDKTAERIEANEKKTRTLGGGSASETGDEYTMGEIAEMTVEDYRRLTPAKRKQILQRFGSNPNKID